MKLTINKSRFKLLTENKKCSENIEIEVPLQIKTTYPMGQEQVIVPDDSYAGLKKVTVDAIPDSYIIPAGQKEITRNGTHDVHDYAYAIVNVQGGGVDYLAMRLTKTSYEYENSEITKLPDYGFRDDGGIVKATFPNVTSIGNYTFYSCTKLTSINIPKLTSLPANAVNYCGQLQHISFPNVTSIEAKAINSCDNLKSLHLPKITSIPSNGIYSCTKLKSICINNVSALAGSAFHYGYSLLAIIITQTDTVATAQSTTFTYLYHILGTTNSTYNPTGAKDGYIYVPDSLVSSYQTASNWSKYATQIKGLSELPQEYADLYGIEIPTPTGYTLTLNCTSDVLNSDTYMYSIDGGTTYNQFTSEVMTLENITQIRFKTTATSHNYMKVGTTSGGGEITAGLQSAETENITLSSDIAYYIGRYTQVGGAD